ncbi:MAG TPA: hypothetical protein VGF88_14210 [Acidobacteriaceae bacterium]|jgi:hypothetical protein
MNRLTSIWIALTAGRGRQVGALRAFALLSFAAILASFVTRGLHHATLADFLGGVAVGCSGGLMFVVFSIESAEFKDDAGDSDVTELNLSR